VKFARKLRALLLGEILQMRRQLRELSRARLEELLNLLRHAAAPVKMRRGRKPEAGHRSK